MFLSAQPQNASELKDLTFVCTAELARHGRGTGFAWAQDASGKSPATRLGAYNGPWVLPSGATVFATKADITGGTGAAVPITESLEGHIGDRKVWTAVDKTGAPKVDKNCSGWNDSKPDSITSGTSTGAWAQPGPTTARA